MKTITETLNLNECSSRIFDMYFKDRSFAIFDIETTGLSPSKCSVILSGILLKDRDGFRLLQFFAENPQDEREIIEETLRILSGVDYIVTYNGKHFDIPFMETRARKYGISFDPAVYNLDLFLVIQGHSDLRNALPNLKQKTIEIFMGLATGREDEISGGESVALYEQYMQTRAYALEKTILLHNHDDLIQLYRLLPVIRKTDFHKAMFKLGFLSGRFLIQKTVIKGKDLLVQGRQISAPCDYISFPTEEKPYSLIMNSTGGDFELTVPCESYGGALYFDAAAILCQNADCIQKYPSVVDGYLIASAGGTVNYMEINGFLLAFFENLTETV